MKRYLELITQAAMRLLDAMGCPDDPTGRPVFRSTNVNLLVEDLREILKALDSLRERIQLSLDRIERENEPFD